MWRSVGQRLMSMPVSARMASALQQPSPPDPINEVDSGVKRAHPLLDLDVQLIDLMLQKLHVAELASEQGALMHADRPLERQLQLGALVPQAGLGQLGQLSRIRGPPPVPRAWLDR
jgi:hypothetical protein